MKNSRSAFTLIELIVVLAILAIILIVVTPKITGYVAEAKQTTVQHNAMAALHAAELYVVDLDRQGKSIPAQLTATDLKAYLNNPKNDTFVIQVIAEDNNKYRYNGTYQSEDWTYHYETKKMTKTKTP